MANYFNSGKRELRTKLSDPTLTADTNQSLSNLLSQTNKVKRTVNGVALQSARALLQSTQALTLAGVPPPTFKGLWSSVVKYIPGDEVIYTGAYWKCLGMNTNSAPTLTNTAWQNVGATLTGIAAYSSGTTYYLDQQVTYNGNVFTCIATTTGNAPSNASYWLLMGPATLDNLADGGTYVRQPSVAGAEGLLANGNFQLGLAGWVAAGGTNTPVAAGGSYGPYSGAAYLQSACTAKYQGVTANQSFAVKPGEFYKLAGYLYSQNSGNVPSVNLILGFYSGTGSFLSGVYCQNSAANAWQYITQTGQVPTGASYALILLQNALTGAATNFVTAIQAWRQRSLDDEVYDGSTYTRLANVNGDHTIHVTSSLLNQGSLCQAGSTNFYYRCPAATSLQFGWDAFTIYAPDGSSISVSSVADTAGPTFTGLTSGEAYYFGVYYTIATATVTVLKSDLGSPLGHLPGSLQQAVFTLNGDGNICIAVALLATPSSGGSGNGVCFTPGTLVVTEHGPKAIAEVRIGDRVKTARATWRPVAELITRPYAGLLQQMPTEDGVTPRHKVLRDNLWVEAGTVFPMTIEYAGIVHNLAVEADPDDDGTRADTEHSFTLSNGEIVHNFNIPPGGGGGGGGC